MNIRLRIDFSYDGSAFHGYAYQNDLRTVQGQLQEAIKILTQQNIILTVAGRTDAGVHARHQVVHFDLDFEVFLRLARINISQIIDSSLLSDKNVQKTLKAINGFSASTSFGNENLAELQDTLIGQIGLDEKHFFQIFSFLKEELFENSLENEKLFLNLLVAIKHSLKHLEIRLNNVLAMLDKSNILHGQENKAKSDIVISNISVVPEEFDARFSALSRKYIYTISDSKSCRDVFRRNYVLWHDLPLNIDLMNEAAQKMLGEFDFLSYCKPREGATTIRTLKKLEVSRNFLGEIEIFVQADAFCHSMVRSIVGVLMAVGQGSRKPCWGRFLLDNPSREHGISIAPAHGLALVKVEYPDLDLLGNQAKISKIKRVLNDQTLEKCCD